MLCFVLLEAPRVSARALGKENFFVYNDEFCVPRRI
jgi:hypothetical protein